MSSWIEMPVVLFAWYSHNFLFWILAASSNLNHSLDIALFLSQTQFMVPSSYQNGIRKHEALFQRFISSVKNLYFEELLCRNIKQTFIRRAQMQSLNWLPRLWEKLCGCSSGKISSMCSPYCHYEHTDKIAELFYFNWASPIYFITQIPRNVWTRCERCSGQHHILLSACARDRGQIHFKVFPVLG